jgi:toxin YoeB
MYSINILVQAERDLAFFRQNDRASYVKCFDLVRELAVHPHEGTGKPERLRYFKQEVYSRRVNHKDRMIYTIYEDLKEIDISSCCGHYDER